MNARTLARQQRAQCSLECRLRPHQAVRGNSRWPHFCLVDGLLGAVRWLDSRTSAELAWLVACLALYILASGLDDVVLEILWLAGFGRRRTAMPPNPAREKRIAILVPLWREADVIGRMLEHNVSAIRYSNYEILAGVYANDDETRQAVEEAAARLPRISLAEVPHDGPTSKGDCLNWIYQRLIERECAGTPWAEIVMIHDAEDLIHPESLECLNRWSEAADMIQIPVLALPTRLSQMTHGVYCDDFAESQTKDLRVRSALGAFLPGCGVGTAFRRTELERLAGAESNRIFDPLSLTEDYDNGLRLFRLGCRQLFLPLEGPAANPVATREYFPRGFGAAVRQRARWITGNCLQAWQQHGWGGGLRRRWLQAWFFWRDRKGLWGSWAGIACNILFLWAVCGWAASAATAGAWAFGDAVADIPWLKPVLAANLVLCGDRILMRAWFSGRLYGWKFAFFAPLRMIWGNVINAAASARALWQFTHSWWTGRPLRWLKTEHCYPSLETLRAYTPARAATAASECLPDCAIPASAGLGRAEWPAARRPSRPVLWREAAPVLPADGLAATYPAKRILRALPAQLSDELGVVAIGFWDGRLEVAATHVPERRKLELLERCAGVKLGVRRVSAETSVALKQYRDQPAKPHWRRLHQPGDPRGQFPLEGSRLAPAKLRILANAEGSG